MTISSKLLAVALCIGLLAPVRAAATVAPAAEISAPTADRVLEQYGQLPLSFEPNVGQAGPGVEFVAHGRGYALLLSEGEAVISLGSGARLAFAPSRRDRVSSRRT